MTWTEQRFAERGLGTPRLDAQLLLAHVLGKDRVYLYTHFDQPLGADELASFRALIQRRLGGESVAYLVGKKEFRSLELAVDARVLVPRPDTETAVDVALALLPADGAARVVDVGTGSGAIALALKKERPALEVLAVDRSPDAAAVARANAERLGARRRGRRGRSAGAGRRARAVRAHRLQPALHPVGRDRRRSPPRCARSRWPRSTAARDGLDVIRRLVADAPPLLDAGGALVLEVGAGQAPAVAALFAADGRYDAAMRHRRISAASSASSLRSETVAAGGRLGGLRCRRAA